MSQNKRSNSSSKSKSYPCNSLDGGSQRISSDARLSIMKRITMAKRAGLIFPPSRIFSQLRKGRYAAHIQKGNKCRLKFLAPF